MHLNIPVLTSDLDFVREICGPAAEYVDPYSLESIRDGILRLKNDAALPPFDEFRRGDIFSDTGGREKLILLGREQSRMNLMNLMLRCSITFFRIPAVKFRDCPCGDGAVWSGLSIFQNLIKVGVFG